MCMLGLCFNTCFSFLEPAGVKEEAGSPVDSKQEVFWCRLIWSLSNDIYLLLFCKMFFFFQLWRRTCCISLHLHDIP